MPLGRTYDQRRKEQIARNKALFDRLALENAASRFSGGPKATANPSQRPAKRTKIEQKPTRPQRLSARIAAADVKPLYSDEKISGEVMESNTHLKRRKASRRPSAALSAQDSSPTRSSEQDVQKLRENWKSWESSAPLPSRDANGTFQFPSHPDFLPNKSPSEMMHEGAFGGTYWRPLFSRALGITVAGDWEELPADWVKGLKVEISLTSSQYDPEVNKFGVASGQTIEQWEAAGWINHEYDVRGWFQWYCRFFQGRRCEDDERQIGRWRKCVGETGRWRRILLRKYQAAGIRTVADEGQDDTEGVSPVIHQTCHHWAWEIRQNILDDWYRS